MSSQNIKKAIICPYCENEVACPFCKSKDIKEFVYGLLKITDKDSFDKQYKIGGGVIEKDSPGFHCETCGKNFGKTLGNSPWKEVDIKKVAEEIKRLNDEKKELEMKVDTLREAEKKMKDIVTKNNKKTNK